MNELSSTPSLTDPEIMQDPFPFYQWAHANSPIVEIPGAGFRVVMGYAVCSEAAGRPNDFSNAFAGALSGARAEDAQVSAILEEGWPQMNTLLTADPPVHTRFRKLVNLAFSMPRVNALETGIREKIVGLIGILDAVPQGKLASRRKIIGRVNHRCNSGLFGNHPNWCYGKQAHEQQGAKADFQFGVHISHRPCPLSE